MRLGIGIQVIDAGDRPWRAEDLVENMLRVKRDDRVEVAGVGRMLM